MCKEFVCAAHQDSDLEIQHTHILQALDVILKQCP